MRVELNACEKSVTRGLFLNRPAGTAVILDFHKTELKVVTKGHVAKMSSGMDVSPVFSKVLLKLVTFVFFSKRFLGTDVSLGQSLKVKEKDSTSGHDENRLAGTAVRLVPQKQEANDVTLVFVANRSSGTLSSFEHSLKVLSKF